MLRGERAPEVPGASCRIQSVGFGMCGSGSGANADVWQLRSSFGVCVSGSARVWRLRSTPFRDLSSRPALGPHPKSASVITADSGVFADDEWDLDAGGRGVQRKKLA